MEEKIMRNEAGKDMRHRVITMLDRNEIDFLDKLGKDALFSTGHKLSYNEILRGLIDFAMDIGLSGDKVQSADDLKAQIIKNKEVFLKNFQEKLK